MIQQFDKVRAEFRPTVTADLKPGLADYIGQIAEFEAWSIIEEGRYAGQWAMNLPRDWHEKTGTMFMPLEDLKIISEWCR